MLVAGGGPAGVPAAVAAARCGARVILCQDRPVLGGNASSEVRMHIVGADASGKRGVPLETEAREGGIIEELRLIQSAINPQRSASMMDLGLYDLCRHEPNLTLLLNTIVVAANCDGERILSVVAERPSTEDRFLIEAQVFVDCTGDGRLGAEADAPYREGRESRGEFDEPLAPPRGDSKRLGSTLLFQARRHDRPMPFQAPAWARRFSDADLRLRPHATGEFDYGHEYGYWWLEWGGELDTIKDNERIRDELLSIMLGAWDHVKNGSPDAPGYPDPDSHKASHWALEWFGFLPGKRESRRFIGLHTLTEQDIRGSRSFEDAIAYGGWPIDTHPPGGVDAVDEPPCTQHPVPHLYDIPLSACVSRDITNLMFAGRNLSATHLGFASTRVMATCAVVGQGVGTAAAYAALHAREPRDLPADRAAMFAIQQRLVRDDCYLIGRINLDPHDLAPSAQINALSEQAIGPAQAVVSGQTRAVHGPGGAPLDRVVRGTHRWMSAPAEGLPAHIELHWPTAVAIGEVQLIFDTGQHRPLTLTLADDYARRMCWGRPQPETVCDYRLETMHDGSWRGLLDVRGNHQRRRVHRLPMPVTTRSLRLVVTRTHGLDHARVCEVRVYPPDTPTFLDPAAVPTQ